MVQEPQSIEWQAIAAAKRTQVLENTPKAWILPKTLLSKFELGPTSRTNVTTLSIPEQSGIMSKQEIALTENYSAKELLAKMAAGEVSSELVTTAFSKRAAIAQQLTNCLTETFYDRALERARFLDNYLKTNKKPFGPLHGLPISIKDSFNYAGIPSTLGLVSFIQHGPESSNSALVDMLLDLGAVLYVKTNIPQSMMTSDSENNVFGRTLNPLNLHLTAGGSTGGESALVAFRGSILGVGTDLGGSIRMPAMCTGVYGFKPTSGRIPYGRQKSTGRGGYIPVRACAGPIATSFEDMELFMETITSAHPDNYDADTDPVPWRAATTQMKESLTIGVLAEDPGFPFHPPVRRALRSAVEKLKAAGHKLVDIPHNPLNSVTMANNAIFKYYGTDPEALTLKAIQNGNEPLVKSLVRMNTIFAKCPESVYELGAMNRERLAMIDSWRKVWVDNKLDVLLMPPAQNTAVEHDHYNFIPYTAMWNLMDFPAAVIPYMKSSKELDPEAVTFDLPAKGPKYDPAMSDGAPCAVQIVARRFKDEECLLAAKIIDEVLKK